MNIVLSVKEIETLARLARRSMRASGSGKHHCIVLYGIETMSGGSHGTASGLSWNHATHHLKRSIEELESINRDIKKSS